MINQIGSKNITAASQPEEWNDHTGPFCRVRVFYLTVKTGGQDTSAQGQHTKYLVWDLRQKALLTFWYQMLTIQTSCHNFIWIYLNPLPKFFLLHVCHYESSGDTTRFSLEMCLPVPILPWSKLRSMSALKVTNPVFDCKTTKLHIRVVSAETMSKNTGSHTGATGLRLVFSIIILFGWLAPTLRKNICMKIQLVEETLPNNARLIFPAFLQRKNTHFPILGVLKALDLKVWPHNSFCKVNNWSSFMTGHKQDLNVPIQFLPFRRGRWKGTNHPIIIFFTLLFAAPTAASTFHKMLCIGYFHYLLSQRSADSSSVLHSN